MAVKFTREGAKRIVAAVEHVEGMYGNPAGAKRRRHVVASGGKILKGKLDAKLSPGGTAMVSIWEFDGTSEVDTGRDVEARDWLLQTGQSGEPDQEIEAGMRVVIARIGVDWYVIAAECPTPS